MNERPPSAVVANAIHAAVCEKIGAETRHIRGQVVAHRWEADQFLISIGRQGYRIVPLWRAEEEGASETERLVKIEEAARNAVSNAFSAKTMNALLAALTGEATS